MFERCLWCQSPNVDRLIQTTEGRQPICKCCHQALSKRVKPRRTRRKSKSDMCQTFFPFMSHNENGSVLRHNIRAGR